MFDIGSRVKVVFADWYGTVVQKTNHGWAVALDRPNIFTVDRWQTPDGGFHNNVGVFVEEELMEAKDNE